MDTKNQEATNCPICGSEKSVVSTVKPFTSKYKAISITIDNIESSVCRHCGEEFFTKDQSDRLEERLKENTTYTR